MNLPTLTIRITSYIQCQISKLVPLQYSSFNPSLTNTTVAAVRTSGFRLSVFRFHSVFSCLRLFPTHNASRIQFTTCSYSGKVVHHASCLPLAVTAGKWSYVPTIPCVAETRCSLPTVLSNPFIHATSHNQCNSYLSQPHFRGEKSRKYG